MIQLELTCVELSILVDAVDALMMDADNYANSFELPATAKAALTSLREKIDQLGRRHRVWGRPNQ